MLNVSEVVVMLREARKHFSGTTTAHELCVFFAVVEAGARGVPQSELLRRTCASAPNLSTILRRLTEDGNYGTQGSGKGYITSEIVSGQHRNKVIRLTASGQQVADALLRATDSTQ